ncbi:6-phosphofructokinase [Alteracholeplasma palmae J233]|uniref:Pyrophosphate--fructose 6-phosphate 1-phosphotransferase n=1 Tax=Alteracholeplasma palmae (strain ATCC 49389 / J233) TaxID=1318466 RepID=U4KQK9_ALTPJ|nr:6-phosphofructokinase [Alteracholeplasma palmae]CCV64760.1 6-phosphofructokinase [Alteracholeplasma palmae J233]
MKKLIGAALLGQSGGPTSVINASAAGVFLEALKHEEITNVYAGIHGIRGILDEDFYDINQEDLEELERLKYTPSSAIGSVRYKLADPSKDDTDYKRLLEVFKKYNIRYFFYNGGNDSMDTCNKISKFMQKENWDVRIVGVPKTIDNDLNGTDHTPGFSSAAKYVATTLMEVYLDATVYDIKNVTIVEIMGRNAGWLAAAANIPKSLGYGPDLIYLPEVDFNIDDFFCQVGELLEQKNAVVIAVSEGIRSNGKYIPELFNENISKDAFGHAQLGGTASILAHKVKEKFGTKTRAIEFSLLQRAAAHLASQTDIDEAYTAGSKAVLAALDGLTDVMVGFKRISNNPYKIDYTLIPLETAANIEQKVPLEWILPHGKGLTKEYNDYVLPLIQGETKLEKENSLPRFARLKKIRVAKK